MTLPGLRRLTSTASQHNCSYSIGLLGCGVVGGSVAKLIARQGAGSTLSRRLPPGVSLGVSMVARRSSMRLEDIANAWYSADPLSVAQDQRTELIVEVMGGLNPAAESIAAALELGKPVVTANKFLLASHPELIALARERRVPLFFEAAVAGGIPAIEFLRTHLAAAKITKITGVLNGSTNYILEKLNAGESLDAAMAEARQLGYLEADPSDDVQGRDAGYKISILHALAFPVKFAERSVKGITDLELPPTGKRWRLLCRATPHNVSVAPELVSPSSPFWELPGPTNALYFETDVGNYWLTGPGAGGMATAGSVMGDIIRCVDWLEAKRGN